MTPALLSSEISIVREGADVGSGRAFVRSSPERSVCAIASAASSAMMIRASSISIFLIGPVAMSTSPARA